MTPRPARATIALMRKALSVALGLLAGAGTAAASEVTRLPNGHVSVLARGAPLGRLLQQFGALARLDLSNVERRLEHTPVDVAVRDVPLEVALGATLQAAGVSFVLWGSAAEELRIAAFPGGVPVAAGEKGTQAAQAAPPPPPVFEPPPDMDPAVAAAIQQGISPDDPDMAMIGTGAPERTLAPEDDPDLAEILGPPPKSEEVSKQP